MGLFDTVHVRCPHCDATVDVQSKAGECYLNVYPQSAVPIGIASDLNGEEETCDSCGLRFTIRCKLPKYTEVITEKL